MSGHSKWSTIKHQKGVTDARRSQLFTKLGREITVAARHAHPGTDIRAVLDGYVSISPLDTTLTDEERVRQLAGLA